MLGYRLQVPKSCCGETCCLFVALLWLAVQLVLLSYQLGSGQVQREPCASAELLLLSVVSHPCGQVCAKGPGHLPVLGRPKARDGFLALWWRDSGQ